MTFQSFLLLYDVEQGANFILQISPLLNMWKPIQCLQSASAPQHTEGFPGHLFWICHIRGGIKKLVFFYFLSKGGGISGNPKNPYQKILKFF